MLFQAQEDAAVLRSLVVPLEEEIKALKDKLREMDAEVRRYQSGNKVSIWPRTIAAERTSVRRRFFK